MDAYWDPTLALPRAEGIPVPEPQGTVKTLPAPATFLNGRWEDKNWRNVPGPFYGAETDTCCTGRIAAPNNIAYDEEGQEFVIRQPQTEAELHQVLMAAWMDPFGGYGADGDRHWTPDLVRDWWSHRQRLIAWGEQRLVDLDNGHVVERDAAQGLQSLLASLQDNSMRARLRAYLFWLLEGRPALSADVLRGLST
jgi:hypothetical protein